MSSTNKNTLNKLNIFDMSVGNIINNFYLNVEKMYARFRTDSQNNMFTKEQFFEKKKKCIDCIEKLVPTLIMNCQKMMKDMKIDDKDNERFITFCDSIMSIFDDFKDNIDEIHPSYYIAKSDIQKKDEPELFIDKKYLADGYNIVVGATGIAILCILIMTMS